MVVIVYYKELRNLLERIIAPLSFKQTSEFYGIQYGSIDDEKIIKKIMITIDLNLKSLLFAVKSKVDFIVSYHPLLDNPIFKFDKLLINKLNVLSKYPISIYILNSAFLGSEQGVSQTLADLLYLKTEEIFELKQKKSISIPVGRICSPKFYSKDTDILYLKDLIERISSNLNADVVQYVGDLQQQLKKIIIIPGDLDNKRLIQRALKYECDCYICSKMTHINAIYSKDLGISLIIVPHHTIEYFALKKLYNYLSLEFPFDEFLFHESNNPFNYYIR